MPRGVEDLANQPDSDELRRKRTEEALRESEERYRALFNGMTEGFALHEIVCDEKGVPRDYRFLDINPAFERLTGLERENVVGRLMSEVLPSEDPFWVQAYGSVALTGEAIRFENYSPALNRHYEVYAYRPAPGQFAVVFVEITERKRMEEALRRSEEHYRLLFETMLQGVVYQNADGTVVSMNPAAERILGKRQEEFLGRTSEDEQYHTLHEDGSAFPAAEHPSMVALTTGQEVKDVVMGVYNPIDRAYRWINVSAVPLFREGEIKPRQVYALFNDITAQRQAEQKLRHSELLLKMVSEESPDPVYVKDRESRLLLANPATLRAMGRSLEDVIGKTDREIYDDPAVGQETMANDRRIMESGCSEQIEERILTPDGYRQFLSTKTPYRDTEGHIIGVIGISRDITERKHWEGALRESEERFRRVFESNMLAITFWHSDGRLSDANQAFCDLIGYTPDEVRAGHVDWRHITPPETLALDYQILEENRLLGICRPYEKEFVHRDGHRVPVLIGAAGLGGTMEQGVAFAVDLTEQKAAESELIASRERMESLAEAAEHARQQLQEVIDGAPTLMYAKDLDGKYIFVNRIALDLFNLSSDDILAKTDYDLFSKERAEHYRDHDRQVLENGPMQMEELATLGDSEEHVLLASKFPLSDPSGKVSAICGISIDITELKRQQEKLARTAEELARSNKDLEHFAYVASHDLQEPLRTVRSYAQLLQKRYSGKMGPDADEFIGFVVDGAGRMHDLITDLLAYSRISSSPKLIEPTDSEGALHEALAALGETIKTTGSQVTNDSLPVVLADHRQLVQLFQNLVGNAIKFRRPYEPPRVHIGASQQGTDWLFGVRDNGIGIAPEYFEKIFTIFERLHGTSEYQGTGIGLAICKRIVERHGGRIWLESEPEAGTTFYFTIPLHERSG